MTEITVKCPASMCPLIAKDGSPWTGQYDSVCPEFDDMDNGGCPWWSMACSTGGIRGLVIDAEKRGGVAVVAGPNKPKRLIENSRKYDCPSAHDCSWQKQAGDDLCPPRLALEKGLDPRVCLF